MLSRSAYCEEVIQLYLSDPGTPEVYKPADWRIAEALFDSGVPLDRIRLAFRLAFVRRANRDSTSPLPPIRSLAYFRAVAANLTEEETDPFYVRYIDSTFEQLRR